MISRVFVSQYKEYLIIVKFFNKVFIFCRELVISNLRGRVNKIYKKVFSEAFYIKNIFNKWSLHGKIYFYADSSIILNSFLLIISPFVRSHAVEKQ